jgi:hypothetical protein
MPAAEPEYQRPGQASTGQDDAAGGLAAREVAQFRYLAQIIELLCIRPRAIARKRTLDAGQLLLPEG